MQVPAAGRELDVPTCIARLPAVSIGDFSVSSPHVITMLRQLPAFFVFFVAIAPSALAQRDPIRLTHGPMLGKPTANSMAIWGRTSDPGEFVVRYGFSPDRLDQASLPAKTTIDHDNTGSARLSGLKSDTRYHYEVWVNGRPHGLPGSFHTLPTADDTRNQSHNPHGLFNFRFEIGSCANSTLR